MKHAFMTAFITGTLLAASGAMAATPDDVKWVNRCVSDNKDEGASREVVLVYCTCMNNKMDSTETRSITQWEKSHEAERKACDREAGWR